MPRGWLNEIALLNTPFIGKNNKPHHQHTVGKVGVTVGCGDSEDLVGSYPLKYNKINLPQL